MKKLENIKLMIFFVVYCFALLLFCSGASPIIDYMGTDSSVFFMIGRGMNNGLVPYKDMFDHKGFYLYVLNYFAALITEKNGMGVVLVETIFFSINTYIVYCILRKYKFEQYLTVVAALLFDGLAVNYFTYQGGNIVETYGMTLQLIAIYLVDEDNKNEENTTEHKPILMLLHGVCVGVMLGLRANSVFMWIGIAICIFFRLIFNKKYVNIICNMFMGIFGVIIGLMPMILYGVFTRSLKEMYFQMITYNLMYLGDEISIGKNLVKSLSTLTISWVWILLIVSIVIVLRSSISAWYKTEYIMMLGFSLVSVCMSGYTFGHYFEYLIPLLLPVIGYMVKLLAGIKKNFWKKAVVCICFLGSIVVNLRFPIKVFANNMSKIYVNAAYECKDILEERNILNKNTKILVTNNNVLFYNKLGVIPSIKYFYTPATSYEVFPDAVDEQTESILSGENDVLVVFYADYENKNIYLGTDYNEDIESVLKSEYVKVLENTTLGMELYVKE